MEPNDFLFGDDGDLDIQFGDIAFGDATLQHTSDLLVATPGSIRQHPVIGAAVLTELLDSTTPDEVRVRIQRELERDGQLIDRIVVRGEDIDIESSYV